MARVAVVRETDNTVINIIVAEVSDPSQGGCFHVDVDNHACGIGWTYDPVLIDFVPPPEPPAEPDPVA
jgi:hypothetical protein